MKLDKIIDICNKYHVEIDLKLGGKTPRAIVKSHTGDVRGFDFKFPKKTLAKIEMFAQKQSQRS